MDKEQIIITNNNDGSAYEILYKYPIANNSLGTYVYKQIEVTDDMAKEIHIFNYNKLRKLIMRG